MHDKQIRRRRAVLALLVVICLILLTDYFGQSSSSPLHSLQQGIVTVLTPIEDGASKVLSPVRDVFGWISSTFNAKGKVAELTRENNQLRDDLAQAHFNKQQYRAFGQLLKLDTDYNLNGYAPVAAEKIGFDPLLWYETITINRGSGAGIKLNDPVVGPGGLVGHVTDVWSNGASVTLITAPKSSVGAVVQNEAADQGLVQPKVGDTGTLTLVNLPQTAQISRGQLVVTSGFQDSNPGLGEVHSLYPPAIPIGTVTNTNTQQSVLESQQVEVTPSVDLQHLSVVQVLTDPGFGS